jgi:hypothetical protein
MMRDVPLRALYGIVLMKTPLGEAQRTLRANDESAAIRPHVAEEKGEQILDLAFFHDERAVHVSLADRDGCGVEETAMKGFIRQSYGNGGGHTIAETMRFAISIDDDEGALAHEGIEHNPSQH